MKAIKLKPRFCDAYNNLASAYMQLGQQQEAMETYQMALVLNPGLVDAHSNLGNLYKASGDTEAAKRCYLEAIRIKPEFPIAWNNLAGLFKDEGQLASAIAYYREAIRLCPEFADAHSNLGNALKEDNQLEDAMTCYQTAVKLRPDFAIAHGNLGGCYYESGDIQAAIRCFKYAIQLEPNFPDAHNNLGNALRDDNKIDEAILSYRAALRLKPDHPHAYNNLGNAMKDKGFIKEAIHCYVTAIRLLPTFAAAHSNLGSILKEQGKLDQALSHYHEAVTIDPLFVDAYSNMGNTYKENGQIEEAIKCYLTSIKIKATHSDAHFNLGAAYKDIGQFEEAIESFRTALENKNDFPDAFGCLVHSLMSVCNWESRDELLARLTQLIEQQLLSKNTLPSLQPFHSLIFPFTSSELLQIARRYSAKVKLNVALSDNRFFFKPKGKNARLKIGYVSSDFGNHPSSHLMQSVYSLHDRSKFDVTCYALTGSDMSSWRKKIESEVETFKDISLLQASDAAQLISNDGIHILINLNGYTKGARNEIFALHPAALQMSYLGFCGTLGAEYIEYMIGDNTSVPSSLRQYYSEKIIAMPHAFLVNDHKQSARYMLTGDKMPSRSQYGISEDAFVFCCFNQFYKIDPEIFDVWMNMLKRIPNAVLWLLRFPSAGEKYILLEARKRGVRESQIIFSDVVSKEEHIKRGFLADLFLDTPNYNAHTTGTDILWSGTPMLTLIGEKMVSRVSASLLKAIGLDELITSSLEEYEQLAVSLAEDSEKLFAMRRHIENNRETCALFDTTRWVRNLENGLLNAWKRHESGSLPEHIDIDDNEPILGNNDMKIFE